jgi:polyisoprenoid-binding protein YceI
MMILLISGALFFTQCSKSDDVEQLSKTNTTGDAVVNTTNGDWNFDKVHSSITWETFYYGTQAFVTGRFNVFNIDVNFDEKNPSNLKIDAWVQLSTFNTGEPGRDGKGKCGPGYMGVTYLDTLFHVNPATDTAEFHSTSAEMYGDGYRVMGDFTFRGVTKTEELYVEYHPEEVVTGHAGDETIASFTGVFTINATTDFGVTGSIADETTIRINAQVNKNE